MTNRSANIVPGITFLEASPGSSCFVGCALLQQKAKLGSTTADYLLEWPAGLSAVNHAQHLDFNPIQLRLQAFWLPGSPVSRTPQLICPQIMPHLRYACCGRLRITAESMRWLCRQRWGLLLRISIYAFAIWEGFTHQSRA